MVQEWFEEHNELEALVRLPNSIYMDAIDGEI